MGSTKYKENLSIFQWNCNNLVSKLDLFKLFLNTFKPDIVLLNELKVDEQRDNFFLNFTNYHKISKPRNNFGGGVAILIKQNLEFFQDLSLDHWGLELVGIKLKMDSIFLSIFCLYNPPNRSLNYEFFVELATNYSHCILGGDLNAKSKTIGCLNNSNNNGNVLETVLMNLNLSLINDHSPTYHQVNRDYYEVLDLYLCSSSLLEKTTDFKVLYNWDMTSDHYPIHVRLNFNFKCSDDENNLDFNYDLKKSDWNKFKELLANNEVKNELYTCKDQVEKIKYVLTEKICEAAKIAIPIKSKSIFKQALPKEIIDLIKERRKAKRIKTRSVNDRKNYNKLTSYLRFKLRDFRNKSWAEFIKKIGKNPMSSKPFWNRINKFRKPRSTNKISRLELGNKVFETDLEIGNCFGQILTETFNLNTELVDASFDKEVNQVVRDFFNSEDGSQFPEITMSELKLAISKTKEYSAVGFDGIHNQMLKNLPHNFLNNILGLFNNSIKNNFVPDSWKVAKISMILKKKELPLDPNNYRPISITSCLGKILERIINNRLYTFMEEKKLLANEQSGFRRHRRTADNLFFLIQKITETFSRSKKVCGLFFDISKAFDRVWHEGLLYKLIKAKIPNYLIFWIRSFLTKRTFRVKVNRFTSNPYPIKAGVPQGSVISPLLFSLYINDIPKADETNKKYSLLFADDLITFFIYKKRGKIESEINKYLKELEPWLCKWKMKICPTKCSFTIFSKNNKEPTNFNLQLFKKNIPYSKINKFLGLHFDERLCFSKQIEEVKNKCINRLNIIKILSGKSWKLDSSTLASLYKSLIGSIIDYNFPCLNSFSDTSMNKIQVIQNTATRSILRLSYDTPSKTLFHEAEKKLKISKVDNRLHDLLERYVSNSLTNQVPLTTRLVKEYLRGFESRFVSSPTPLCCCYLTIEKFSGLFNPP